MIKRLYTLILFFTSLLVFSFAQAQSNFSLPSDKSSDKISYSIEEMCKYFNSPESKTQDDPAPYLKNMTLFNVLKYELADREKFIDVAELDSENSRFKTTQKVGVKGSFSEVNLTGNLKKSGSV